MSASDLTSFSLEQAHSLLKRFDCTTQQAPQPAEREQLCQALLAVAHQSDYQILGICAETFEQGWQALKSYAQALGYNLQADLKPIAGSVYLKFNPKTGLCYVDSYDGDHRGVLVSCQSAYESGLNEMYGHLPLDLFP
ncbi:MAG: DUF1824 family protein [Elainellaceae cyanobacterium]